jgi:hypothetical protein
MLYSRARLAQLLSTEHKAPGDVTPLLLLLTS